MATADIPAPLARMVAIIEALPAIGFVHPYDLYSRKDLRPLIVSEISGQDVLRAWWFSGPTMVGKPMVQTAGGWCERTWLWTIYGVEGLTDDGSSLETVRANALAIVDALDADRDLAGSCHRTQPTRLTVLENRAAWSGIGASYVQLAKEVVTLSTP